MPKKASGREIIQHKQDHIALHFNNPELSDVTLSVGKEDFAAHRFVLATQSTVFREMLLSKKNGKEPAEEKIALDETPIGKSAFSKFLKFFYTGKLVLTVTNVCGIHTLADKYDVSSLKGYCLGFMKDVLTGVHGDALEASLMWMQYLDNCESDLLSACYSAIRTNFLRITHIDNKKFKQMFVKLSDKHIEAIMNITKPEDELVLSFEIELVKLNEMTNGRLLPFIRFYNFDLESLHAYENNPDLKQYCMEAYKIHAERAGFLSDACKQQRKRAKLSDVEASCSSCEGTCVHINPRLSYHIIHYMHDHPSADEEPIDLSNLPEFAEKMQFSNNIRYGTKQWKISVVAKEDLVDPICETYTITPAKRDVGRRYTIAIIGGDSPLEPKYGYTTYQYCIKHSGEVKETDGKIEPITMVSPIRSRDDPWEYLDQNFFGAAILLH